MDPLCKPARTTFGKEAIVDQNEKVVCPQDHDRHGQREKMGPESRVSPEPGTSQRSASFDHKQLTVVKKYQKRWGVLPGCID